MGASSRPCRRGDGGQRGFVTPTVFSRQGVEESNTVARPGSGVSTSRNLASQNPQRRRSDFRPLRPQLRKQSVVSRNELSVGQAMDLNPRRAGPGPRRGSRASSTSAGTSVPVQPAARYVVPKRTNCGTRATAIADAVHIGETSRRKATTFSGQLLSKSGRRIGRSTRIDPNEALPLAHPSSGPSNSFVPVVVRHCRCRVARNERGDSPRPGTDRTMGVPLPSPVRQSAVLPPCRSAHVTRRTKLFHHQCARSGSPLNRRGRAKREHCRGWEREAR
jgi:hypothetical protein